MKNGTTIKTKKIIENKIKHKKIAKLIENKNNNYKMTKNKKTNHID